MRRVVLRLAFALTLLAVSGFGSDASRHIAQAELNPAPAGSNIDGSKHIARNIIENKAIAVCTDDYENALADAVAVWNDGLRNHTPAYIGYGSRIFKATCEDTQEDSYVDYVEVDSRSPEDDGFYCGDEAKGCFIWPARSGPPHYTFSGRLLIIMNERVRSKEYDSLKRPVGHAVHRDYRDVVRTMVHELGHALGFGHYCFLTQYDVHSAMECSNELMPDTLQVQDFANYAAIYKPRTVVKRIVDGELKPFVDNVDGLPGTVEFNFDASNVFVEESIQIRRWSGTAWDLLREFGPATGEVTWVAGAQPTDSTQVYRIFSTTQAYLEHQCLVSSPVCSSSITGPGQRVGFSSGPLPVQIPAADGARGRTYDLNVVVDGVGSYTVTPPGPYLAEGEPTTVTLTALVNTAEDETYDEIATTSAFDRWTGACSGTSTTCILTMDKPRSVTATFIPNMHTLTPTTDGSGLTLPAQADSYPAGSTVTVWAKWNKRTHAVGSWTGCNYYKRDRCDVYMSRAKTVTARFVERPSLDRLALSGVSPNPIPLASDTVDYEAVFDGSGPSTIVSAAPPDNSYDVDISPTVGDPLIEGDQVDVPWGKTTEITVTVTRNELTRTYTVTVRRPDVRLSNLALSEGALSPTFDAETTSYSATVSAGTSSVTVTATRSDSNASVTITSDMDSSTPGGVVELTPGATNTITIAVSLGGVTRTYAVAVFRPGSAPAFDEDEPSPEFVFTVGQARPKTLPAATGGDWPRSYMLTRKLDEGDLPDGLEFLSATRVLYGEPELASPRTEYTLTVTDADDETDTLPVYITVRGPVVSISADDTSVREGVPARFTVTRTPVASTPLTVYLSADDRTGDFIAGTPAASVEIAANSTTASYEVATEDDTVHEDDGSITVTIGRDDAYTTIGTASATVAVTDDDAAPGGPRLSALSLSGVTLDPAFSPDRTSYDGSAPHSVERTTVTATPEQNGATVSMQPGDTSNAAGHQVDLDAGTTTPVTVTVTAADGLTTETYRVDVVRAADLSAPPVISGFSVDSSENLTASFTWSGSLQHFVSWELHRADSQSGSYGLDVSKVDSSTDVEFSGRSRGYWYKLRGQVCEEDVLRSEGDSEDEPRNPTLTCGLWSDFAGPVELPPVLDLSALTLSGATFSFASGTTSYSVTVGDDLAQTTVTATASDSTASVSIDPADASGNTAGHQVNLPGGATTEITVTVTHGGASRVYTVAVTRPDPFVAPVVTGFSGSGTQLTGTFTWSGSTPRFLSWELHRADSEQGTYSSVATASDSLTPVIFSGQSVGYWYKLRGQVCEEDVLRSEGDSEDEPRNPTLTCGLWSDFAGPVELPPVLDLSALTLSGATFSFASGTTSYSVTVGDDLAQTTVTATASDSTASVSIDPADASGNTAGHQVNLPGGATTEITVTVTHGGASRVYTVAVTRPDPFVAPVVTGFSGSGTQLTGTFTWSGSTPRFLSWELHRADSEQGTYSSVATASDSLTPVIFSGQSVGYWYKLRGQACDEDVLRSEGDSEDEPRNPTLTCGLWSDFAGPAELPPSVTIVRVSSPVTEGDDAEFEVERTGSTGAALSVTVSVSETGAVISGSAPTSVTISSGSSTATLAVSTDDDSQDEADSVVAARILDATAYDLGFPALATVTVKDDDCVLTVTAGAGGSASGGGTYKCGQRPPITATPSTYYEFDRWSGDSTSTSATISIFLNGNKSVHATFERQECELTVTAGTGGSASGGGTYDCGTWRPISATPSTYYEFDEWSGDSTSTSASTRIFLSGDKSVHATFERQECELTVTAGTGGSASGGGTYDCGTWRTVSASASNYWEFDRWSGDSTSTSATISIFLSGDKSVHATFERQECELMVTAGTGGSASGGGTYGCGTWRPISATPSTYYEFDEWSGDSTSTSATVSIFLSGDKSVHATFERQECELTVTAGTGGSASGGGTYDCGTWRPISATPSTYYEFDEWSGDSTSTSASTRIFLSGDESVHATFSRKQCELTVTAGTGGSASGDGTQDCGTYRLAVAYPDTGHRFTAWSGASTSTTSFVSVFLNADKSLHASFAVLRFTLTASASGGGSVSGGGTYDYNTAVTVTATADELWYFSNWIGDASGSSSSITITMTSNKSVTAIFESVCNMMPELCSRDDDAGGGPPGGGTDQ